MAPTLKQAYDFLKGTPELKQRFVAARLNAGWTIYNESAGTSNHTNRLAWAKNVFTNSDNTLEYEWAIFLSNTTIQDNHINATDGQIVTAVNGFLNNWANDFAGA